jgi:hypothetical protein
MFSTRRHVHLISMCLLLLSLVTQAAFAFNAGFMYAPQSQQQAENSAVAPRCHGSVSANVDPTRSLCRLHCTTDGQSLMQYDIPLLPSCQEAAPILRGLGPLALQDMPIKLRIPPCSWRNAFPDDPAIAMRFCSFLI